MPKAPEYEPRRRLGVRPRKAAVAHVNILQQRQAKTDSSEKVTADLIKELVTSYHGDKQTADASKGGCKPDASLTCQAARAKPLLRLPGLGQDQ